MLKEHDINFLRYLTAKTPLSVFENCLLSSVQKKFSLKRLRGLLLTPRLLAESAGGSRGYHIYISLPFCVEDCAYCHCSHSRIMSSGIFGEYERYLKEQMLFFSPFFKNRKVLSVYFGGGSPSIFPARSLDAIFQSVSEQFMVSPGMDMIFEGHPASLTESKVAFLERRGITRLTVGVQSLDDKVLRTIERRQTARLALRCIERVRKSRIPFMNVDLVAGLPGQSVASFIQGLKQVMALEPDGIHVNPFSQVFKIRYYKRRPCDFPELVRRRQEMLEAAKAVLGDGGYYREGFEGYQRSARADNSQQTDFLERSEDILGLGHGAQTMIRGHVIFRDVSADLKGPVYHGFKIEPRYSMAQYIILHALKGLPYHVFEACFGIKVDHAFAQEISFLCQAGILRMDQDALVYCGPWTMEGLFDYFVFTKVFFGSRLLELVRKRSFEYDPGRSYDFASDGFRAKMDDPFFLLTLYDVGY